VRDFEATSANEQVEKGQNCSDSEPFIGHSAAVDRPRYTEDATAPEASLPAPSAWAVEMYGPSAAAEQMRAARHPDESPAEFAERVRRGRRAARHAETILQTADPSTVGSNYLRR
jgi:hypothetical protein